MDDLATAYDSAGLTTYKSPPTGRDKEGPLGLWYMGVATDFKVGVQNRIRERSERKKNFVPPLFQMWGYKQANISRDLLNILKFAVWLSH